MNKFATQYNNKKVEDREANYEPSLTIPDQSMTIKQIMIRYAKGIPISGERVPVYDGDEDFYPDFKNMDLADRQQYLEDAKAEIASATEEIKRRETANKKAKSEAAREAYRKKERDQRKADELYYEDKENAAIRKRSGWSAAKERERDNDDTLNTED